MTITEYLDWLEGQIIAGHIRTADSDKGQAALRTILETHKALRAEKSQSGIFHLEVLPTQPGSYRFPDIIALSP